jgi:CheY-like chemotaxis protein
MVQMTSSVEHMASLLDDVLVIQKIEDGALELLREAFDFPETIRKTERLFAAAIQEKGITFTIDECINIGLGACWVLGDKHRIVQITANFISNAIKFTPTGGTIKVKVTKESMAQPGMCKIRVAVQDSGIGISPENLKVLFQPYVQLDAAHQQNGKGTGLGLSICKLLTNLLGGDVAVTSPGQVGQGSEFSYWIPFEQTVPLTRSPQPTFPVADSYRNLDDTASGTWRALEPLGSIVVTPLNIAAPVTLLLVDDLAITRELTANLLRRQGFHCLCACDGRDAIEKLEVLLADPLNPKVNAVLMDDEMPIMSGREAVRLIRDRGWTLPVLGVTGNVLAEDTMIFRSAGCDKIFFKPVDIKLLAKTIRKYLAPPNSSLGRSRRSTVDSRPSHESNTLSQRYSQRNTAKIRTPSQNTVMNTVLAKAPRTASSQNNIVLSPQTKIQADLILSPQAKLKTASSASEVTIVQLSVDPMASIEDYDYEVPGSTMSPYMVPGKN